MPPREQHESEFIQDVGVGDVKVVFKGGYRDVAIKLAQEKSVNIFRNKSQ